VSSKLEEHLSRCSTSLLTPFLGSATLALLEKVGTSALTPQGIAYLVTSMFGGVRILRSQSIRHLLFANLSNEEGTALCSLLELPTVATGMTLANADFDHNLRYQEMLMRWYGVTGEEEEDNAHECETSRRAVAGHRLRPHQLLAYQKLRHLISDPTACPLVRMPYGAGKLRLVVTAVLDLYRSEPDGSVIIWLAPGEALCDEAFTELRLVWEQLGSRDVTIFRLYGTRPIADLDNLANCIVVADITRLNETSSGLTSLGQKARVVILGDAELIGHSSSAGVIRKLSESGKFNLIGISASPADLIDKSPLPNAIWEKFGDSNICMESLDPLIYLRDVGHVNEITIKIATVHPCAIEIDNNTFDLSHDNVRRLSEDVNRNNDLLDLLQLEAKVSGRIVFFTTTAEHARFFAGLLALRGIKAMAVTSEVSPDQRARSIEKFNARDDKILCIHGFFISGESVPEVTVGIIAAPTLSGSIFHEMIGRLASDRGADKRPLRIVIVDDSIPRHKHLITCLGTWDKLKI
jgi:superfamily II DNA or RNA helicase